MVGMAETDRQYIKCYDCNRGVPYSAVERVEVPMDIEDGSGYDLVPVPVCYDCRLDMWGHECEHCGRKHMDLEAAYNCCVGATKAPDCRLCGRRMSIGAKGFGPVEGHTITWAKCECCPVGWGRFTGWTYLDGEQDCKHAEEEGGQNNAD